MREHGPWKILSSRTVYRDPWINLRRDEVIRPDGQEGSHCVLNLKPGISVLPLDEDGQVYLTSEFHYGIGRESLEVVSGGIDEAETPEQAAQRELLEELGIRASRLEFLAEVDPFTTVVVSPTRLYLATGLSFHESRPEGTEQIRCVRMPLAEAIASISAGRITHAPSSLAILLGHRVWEQMQGRSIR